MATPVNVSSQPVGLVLIGAKNSFSDKKVFFDKSILP